MNLTSVSFELVFFTSGLALILFYQWYQWRRDLARLAQLPQPAPLPALEAWARLPTVSVLVPAWNEASHLPRLAQSFHALRYPHKELVLVAGGEDGSFSLAQSLAGQDVLVLEQTPGEGKQRALRKGLTLCSGEVIFLTDADCFLEDEPFERTLLPLLEGEAVATGSRCPLSAQIRIPFIVYQWLLHEYGAWRNPPYLQGLEGRNAALHRHILDKLGGFQHPAPIGTDAALAARLAAAGIRIRYLPASRMQTEHPYQVSAYLRQQSRWQRNLLLHGSPAQRRGYAAIYLARSLLALASLAGAFTLLCPFRLLTAAWGLLVIFGLTSRLRYLEVGRRTLPATFEILPPNPIQVIGFMAVEYLAWLRLWWDYFFEIRRWSW